MNLQKHLSVLAAVLVLTSTGQELHQQKIYQSNTDLGQELEQFSQMRQNILPSLSAFDLCTIIPNPYNVSKACFESVCDIGLALSNTNNTWPKKVLDSWGKPPPNVLSGKLTWLGSYSECVGIDVPENKFNTKYCNTLFPFMLEQAGTVHSVNFKYGVCMPSTCTEKEIPILLNEGITQLLTKYNITFLLTASQAVCQLESQPFTSNAVIVLIVLSLFVAIMLVATAYDIYLRQIGDSELPIHISKKDSCNHTANEKTPLFKTEDKSLVGSTNMGNTDKPLGLISQLVLSFSVYTNGSKLLSTNQGAGALTCINGIRFLSISWVLLGHTFVFAMTMTDSVLSFEQSISNKWTYQAILNATVSVDSFFVLSGLLVTYLFLKEAKKSEGKVNWVMFYFHRFWRLTPPYMLVMMTYSTLFKYWSYGPLWNNDGIDPYCGDYWWRNILYINNLFDSGMHGTCMAWSWYLANDMQFYIISPLVLLPMFWKPALGIVICAILCCSSMIATGIISSYNHLPASLINQISNAKAGTDGFDQIYDKPWTRIGPYLIGMLTGYVLYRYRCSPPFKSEYKNWFFSLCGWCVATVCCLAVLYGLFDASQNGGTTYQVAALYNAVNRTVWAVGLCWVIYACCIGYGGFVNTLMSWKVFIPLSRLTYCVYLIHPVLMYYYYLSRATLIHIESFTATYFFLGHLVLSFGAAFIVSLAFESPMLGMEKAIFGKRKKAQ